MVNKLTIFAAIIFIASCASNDLNLRVSSDINFHHLSGLTQIVKMGDMVALTDGKDKKLVVTENFKLDLGLDSNIKPDSVTFFEQVYTGVYSENEMVSEKEKQFSESLLLEGFESKEKLERGNYIIYIWHQANYHFVAIINDIRSEYFLNIIGVNVDPEALKKI